MNKKVGRPKRSTKKAPAPDKIVEIEDSPLAPSSVVQRKPLQSITSNVRNSTRSKVAEHEAASAAEERARVLIMCDTIDRELKSRSAVLRAVTSAQLSSSTALLDLQLSQYPPNVQNVPLVDYLKLCPGYKSITRSDGTIQLQRITSPYPTLEGSKKNLNDILTNFTDNEPKGNSEFHTPGFARRRMLVKELLTKGKDGQIADQNVAGEELSWPEYYARLCASRQTNGVDVSLRSYEELTSEPNSAVSLKGGLMIGVTPKTVRLPKCGEVMLSINGSPLGQFGKTPGEAGQCVQPRTRSRRETVSATTRSKRDL